MDEENLPHTHQGARALTLYEDAIKADNPFPVTHVCVLTYTSGPKEALRIGDDPDHPMTDAERKKAIKSAKDNIRKRMLSIFEDQRAIVFQEALAAGIRMDWEGVRQQGAQHYFTRSLVASRTLVRFMKIARDRTNAICFRLAMMDPNVDNPDYLTQFIDGPTLRRILDREIADERENGVKLEVLEDVMWDEAQWGKETSKDATAVVNQGEGPRSRNGFGCNFFITRPCVYTDEDEGVSPDSTDSNNAPGTDGSTPSAEVLYLSSDKTIKATIEKDAICRIKQKLLTPPTVNRRAPPAVTPRSTRSDKKNPKDQTTPSLHKFE
ncbi:hypothetical protein KIPB_009744 [Kipferlia bialata]|uniref:Uncharacterized protein n=1 Tax=Kipferlia bialata TaxID=797122 RepID=A0A391NTS5_9EUKA|nr:hypothetical protein KIPB_009744 [Kipferlia bialata]|eukprot:g9744.t1